MTGADYLHRGPYCISVMKSAIFNACDAAEFESITPATIQLSTAVMDKIVEQFAVTVSDDGKWQAWLNVIARMAVIQWLQTGLMPPTPVVDVDNTHNTILYVGEHRLCVLAIGTISTPSIELPLTTSTGTPAAQFYLLVEVYEELGQVNLIAGMRHDQLLAKHPVLTEKRHTMLLSQTVVVPLSHFQLTPEQLLLYLSCLSPQPEPKLLTAQLIDASQWFRKQLDAVSCQLAWALLPPPVLAMRSVQIMAHSLLERLATQGITLPTWAKGAAGPMQIGTTTCELYTWVWPLMGTDEPEWSLFLVLGPAAGETLVEGTELTVWDMRKVLARTTVGCDRTYLYTQVIGTWQERFWVQVTIPGEAQVILPGFCFGELNDD